MEDRRKEFNKEFWSQGKVLITRRTMFLSSDELAMINEEEKRCCFVRFSEVDEGRNRILVYRFKSSKDCAKAIEKHNNNLLTSAQSE